MQIILARAAFVMLLVHPGLAAARGTDSVSELWTTATVTGPLAARLSATAEFSVRAADTGTRAPTQLARVALGYQITKPVSIWLGFVRNVQRPEGRPTVRENRIYQQLTWTVAKLGPGMLVARTRFEQRMIENGGETGLRLREQLRYTLSVKGSKTSIVLTTEPFFALNSTAWGAAAGFDQWRNYVGLGIALAPGLNVDIGYLNRYTRRNNARDRLDHIVPVTLAYRF